ncbi:hypothetical protein C2G38_2234835 [Gigaspora rosea]|uniref:Uncharacterized protein n=1 Tax=Gigaspora rosea TaxID=44941 RepID=A0A397TQW5_9GLOM|nr:hypothetical protein C2G38_2234835 [Gigaspora rosea]
MNLTRLLEIELDNIIALRYRSEINYMMKEKKQNIPKNTKQEKKIEGKQVIYTFEFDGYDIIYKNREDANLDRLKKLEQVIKRVPAEELEREEKGENIVERVKKNSWAQIRKKENSKQFNF